jgi:DNA polymerase
MTIWCDIETRSAIDLKTAGVYVYSEDPSFRVLMIGYSIDGAEPDVAVGDDQIRALLPTLLEHDLIAHNAPFERVCLGRLDPRLAEPERWTCTMVMATEAGLPAKLEMLAKAVGAELKDTAGTRLISLFCKPRPRVGGFVEPEDRPTEWLDFVEYCAQDVATLMDVHQRLPEVTPTERALWLADQRINDRGVQLDTDLIGRAIGADEVNRVEAMAELRSLTGLANPNSVQQLGGWLGMPSLAADAVTAQLEREDDPARRRVLELRQLIAESAVKKYGAAKAMTCADGRARGQLQFFGAHTGRWSGRGIQLQNLPREHFETTAERDAVLLDLELGLGASPRSLKAMIRPMLLGPLTVVDFAQIEARVIAWLAGERWVLDAFESGRDIYVETAQAMGPDFTRQQGKTAVLACGFGGSVGALRRMGAAGSDEYLMPIVEGYRRANPAIVRLWYGLWDALLYGGKYQQLEVRRVGKDRHLMLPSGRAIVYRNLQKFQGPEDDRPQWYFQGKFARSKLWHGVIAENVTQAIARDLLAAALLKLEEHTDKVIGHVHDEVILDGALSVDKVAWLMCDAPSWAAGLPLGAEGFVCDRYQK